MHQRHSLIRALAQGRDPVRSVPVRARRGRRRRASVSCDPVPAAGAEDIHHGAVGQGQPGHVSTTPAISCSVEVDERADAFGDPGGGLLRRGDHDHLCARAAAAPTEIATSPVPGGRSSSSTSRSPQNTSEANCSIARCIFGPRHTTACPSGTNIPMLITATPCACGRHQQIGDLGGLVGDRRTCPASRSRGCRRR